MFQVLLLDLKKTAFSPTEVPISRTTDKNDMWPGQNCATQQEESRGKADEASPIFGIAPLHYHLSSASCPISRACKGSKLYVAFENLLPDDLRWS